MTWQTANPTKAKACGHWSAMSQPRNVKRMIVPTISDSGVAQLSNLSNQCIVPTHISSLWNSCNVRRLRCTCFILFHFVLEFLPFQTSDAFVVAWWLVAEFWKIPRVDPRRTFLGNRSYQISWQNRCRQSRYSRLQVLMQPEKLLGMPSLIFCHLTHYLAFMFGAYTKLEQRS